MKKLMIVLLILVLVSCGGGGADAPAGTATPTPEPTPTPTPTPAPAPVGITIRGKITGAPAGMNVVLECVHPISAPNQWGCNHSTADAYMGAILETFATVDANGDYVFDTTRVQYHQPAGGLPIPAGYAWRVIPYSCSMYWYGNVYVYPLAPLPYGCTPTERVFDLPASVTGIDFFMWATP